MMVEFRHASADFRVVETTYFCRPFNRPANGSSAGAGSNASACPCHVLRPSRRVSALLISSNIVAPISSCQYGIVQPPCANPPSVSSSAPPGACMTPSSETNSATVNFLMLLLLLPIISFCCQMYCRQLPFERVLLEQFH